MRSKIEKLLQVFHTLKYLKFEQFWFRLLYRFKKPNVQLLTIPVLNEHWRWSGPAIYKQSIFDKNSVEFLSLPGSLDTACSWNDPTKEKLWLYNLHYFDDLNASNFSSREQLHFNYINRWILENPPCIGNGWEPYPLSLRILNWIKWFSKQDGVEQKYLSSMLQQASALSQQLEYHILGNHLFANAKALTFIGCYISDGKAERYLDLGLKLLDREVPEQFLADGAHFELSPMYHEILLWDLLELIDLANTSQHTKLVQRLSYWKKVATKALFWLKSMVHPDGEISFFNDSAIGIAAKPQQIFDYAQSLGLEIVDNLSNLITNEHSGYSRISSSIYTLIIDHANVGPDYLPGHAHADTLSFELSVGCERVFVNSGTSLYGVSKERLRQRQTAAHNTVVVDGENSSEVWSGFRVARRAYSKLVKVSQNDNDVCLQAEHNGYQRLKGKVTHSRCFATNNQEIQIKDELIGQVNQACAFFHLHPNIEVERITQQIIKLVTKSNVKLTIHSTSRIEILDGTYHPEFGVFINNKHLRMDLVDNKLDTIISIIED
ncbi:alginate lyase family protein [Aliivibrio sp. S2TY2]|uniref:heparinase II/III family protein n=1 Tax=unclassified Aliivibrio TaxID=2645654 RepID=UPI002377DDA5|nr:MULTISPECIES: alginate lyase family protein [unclassified Aliivibrio]MDD9174888.1 alginate lyase family protein [Aliivibrio sp. S3TY1]MDD9192165.1 alginate lyase family protein [Aliivibrio sp. S2TY2]